MVKLVITNKSP